MIEKIVYDFLSLVITKVNAAILPPGGPTPPLPPPDPGPIIDPSEKPPQISEMFGMVDNIVGKIFPFAVFLAMAMIVYGGYMWMISGGDPARKQQAQGTLTWAVIALVFVALIRTFIYFIMEFIF